MRDGPRSKQQRRPALALGVLALALAQMGCEAEAKDSTPERVVQEFIERMQRYYFRHNIDIPGVLTSLAAILMVGVALSFVFQSRG